MHMALPEPRPLLNLRQSSAGLPQELPLADVTWEEALLNNSDGSVDSPGTAPILPDKVDAVEALFSFGYDGLTPQMPASFVIFEAPRMDGESHVAISEMTAPRSAAQPVTDGQVHAENGLERK